MPIEDFFIRRIKATDGGGEKGPGRTKRRCRRFGARERVPASPLHPVRFRTVPRSRSRGRHSRSRATTGSGRRSVEDVEPAAAALAAPMADVAVLVEVVAAVGALALGVALLRSRPRAVRLLQLAAIQPDAAAGAAAVDRDAVCGRAPRWRQCCSGGSSCWLLDRGGMTVEASHAGGQDGGHGGEHHQAEMVAQERLEPVMGEHLGADHDQHERQGDLEKAERSRIPDSAK